MFESKKLINLISIIIIIAQQSMRRRDPPPPPPQSNGLMAHNSPNSNAHYNSNKKFSSSNPMLHIQIGSSVSQCWLVLIFQICYSNFDTCDLNLLHSIRLTFFDYFLLFKLCIKTTLINFSAFYGIWRLTDFWVLQFIVNIITRF